MALQLYPRRVARGRLTLFVRVGLIALLGVAPLAQPTPAAAFSAAPQPNTWITNGPVSAVALSGNTVYLGGAFTYVGPPTGSFVALDQGSGSPIAPFAQVRGTVSAIAADSAGGWYLGGTFTAIGGVTRNNLAHIRADRTLDLAWNPNAN